MNAAEPVADAVLRLTNVEAAYGPVTAIRGVSLAVPRGAIVAVLGANGAGKTTTMKAISGILEPTKGQIDFEGAPIHAVKPAAVVRAAISPAPGGPEWSPLVSVLAHL